MLFPIMPQVPELLTSYRFPNFPSLHLPLSLFLTLSISFSFSSLQTMNELLYFVVLPMVCIPLASLVAAWTWRFASKFHVWMLHQSIDAVRKDIQSYEAKMTAWNKDLIELNAEVMAEDAEAQARKQQLQTILQGMPAAEQAHILHSEAERRKYRKDEFVKRLITLMGDREYIGRMLMKQAEKVEALDRKVNQYRA
ncbi:hypothetical protein PENNAL_c0017G05140 [Penicillium nalgiovense]|uniref:Uncharacterized protein n=1 Tax=Penicillium nalgiovense TaxID=60175 RepID=A0A1V6YLI0_PENNA|nr:hypothetical protein PENNAL_c0017G05140 [Penicillium nalgiovense]